MSNTEPNTEIDAVLYSSEKANLLPELLTNARAGKLEGTIIGLYHPDLCVPEKADNYVASLSTIDRFVLAHNPWCPIPCDDFARLDALDTLEAMLEPTNSGNTSSLRQLVYMRAELLKKLSSDFNMPSEFRIRTELGTDSLIETLDAIPINVYDLDTAKATLRNLKLGKDDTANSPITKLTLGDYITSQSSLILVHKMQIAESTLDMQVDRLYTSHADNLQKLQTLATTLQEDFSEATEVEAELVKCLSNYIFTYSNMIILRMYDPNVILDFNIYVDELTAQINQEVPAVQQLFNTFDLEVLFNQSQNSIHRQLKEANRQQKNAVAELADTASVGRDIYRGILRKEARMGGSPDLGNYVESYIPGALFTYLYSIPELGTVRKNTFLYKHIPAGDFVEIDGCETYLDYRDILDTYWESGMSFAEFISTTYFTDIPELNHFWTRFEPVVSRLYNISLTDIAKSLSADLVDAYIDHASRAQETTSAGDINPLALLATEHEVRKQYIHTFRLIARTAHEINPEVTQEELINCFSEYVGLMTRLIDSPKNGGLFADYFVKSYFGVSPIKFISLKCGRWISPYGNQNVVPHTGDYETVDKNGNPILRSSHTERANLATFLDFPPQTMFAQNHVIIADSDITNALGYGEASPQVQNMRAYLEDVSSVCAQQQIACTSLSRILEENTELREQYYTRVLAALNSDADSDFPVFFNSTAHKEGVLEQVNLQHSGIKGWTRSPAHRNRTPLHADRYILEKYADYATFSAYLSARTMQGENVVLLVGGRDPIIELMHRVQKTHVPILPIAHFSDYN
ncbi:MAG: hypothetical protein R3B92_03170 [Patescibacteria group bacterium]